MVEGGSQGGRREGARPFPGEAHQALGHAAAPQERQLAGVATPIERDLGRVLAAVTVRVTASSIETQRDFLGVEDPVAIGVPVRGVREAVVVGVHGPRARRAVAALFGVRDAVVVRVELERVGETVPVGVSTLEAVRDPVAIGVLASGERIIGERPTGVDGCTARRFAAGTEDCEREERARGLRDRGRSGAPVR
tara:strand:+ start:1284 stop:1865 length:582 start_codon:yes stop_codon:yes gene_type:complete